MIIYKKIEQNILITVDIIMENKPFILKKKKTNNDYQY